MEDVAKVGISAKPVGGRGWVETCVKLRYLVRGRELAAGGACCTDQYWWLQDGAGAVVQKRSVECGV